MMMNPTSQTPSLSGILCPGRLRTHLLLILSLLSVAASALAAPGIVIADPEHDFGRRRSGERIEHSFRIRNSGSDALEITGIRASCGCTTAQKKNLRVAPGASVDLPVEVDLTGRSGPQNQFITFTTNDPENRTVSLRMKGHAVADIEIEPRTLNLGLVDPEQPSPGTVTLRSTTGSPFEIHSVRANKDRVRAEVTFSEDRQTATVKVAPRPQKGDGRFTDVLMIDMSATTRTTERVLVMWQVSTGVTVAPGQVNLVTADRPQLLNRYLMVKGYPGIPEPLVVRKVEWPDQPQVEISFADTGRFGWRIHLRNFEPVAGMDGSEILVHTNAEGFETLRVPVNVLQ